MRNSVQRVLLVEGQDDLWVIPYLMEHNGVPWEKRGECVPEIEPLDGIDALLKTGVISTYLKASDLEVLGVMVDANDSLTGRWQAIRRECVQAFPNIDDELPLTGGIWNNDDGLRLGVWIMPDNQSPGMLESFLKYLVPNTQAPLWQYAIQTTQDARNHEARYRDVHVDKANIHSWLAWQDPPGVPLHHAVLKKILDPHSPHARPFVDWFKLLYGL